MPQWALSKGPATVGPCRRRSIRMQPLLTADLRGSAWVSAWLVRDDVVAWIGPTGDEPDPGHASVVDAGGATIVPGMVDAHAHLPLPGGSHWIDHGFGSSQDLAAVAEDNAALAIASGVRWLRDVGSPMRPDADGVMRAMTLQMRDRWVGRGRDMPYIRAAGAWLAREGALPLGLAVEAADGDELLKAAMAQLDAGADLVKLYLDGPDPDTAPSSTAEVAAVVAAAHRRGTAVTAHATRLTGAAVAANARVDAIEHGFELDADIAATMATGGTFLVSTPAVMESWRTFGSTTAIPRFVTADGRAAIADRRAKAIESVQIRPSRRRPDCCRDGFRRRLAAGQPAGLGGGEPGARGPGTLGGSRFGHMAGRGASRRAHGRIHPVGWAQRLLPGAWRSAQRPGRSLEGMEGGVGSAIPHLAVAATAVHVAFSRC